MKKAIIIGGTGMVGRELVKQLCDHPAFDTVVSLVRSKSGYTHAKLNEIRIDFDKPETYKPYLNGDVLFSTLGTTRAKAGSKDAQYTVDFCYQYDIAKLACESGVEDYILVSSAGANTNSTAFYTKMKGQLDDAVSQLPFHQITILRPGPLKGNRIEKRPLEFVSLAIIRCFNRMGLFRKYHPIFASDVARAMINAHQTKKSGIFTLHEVFSLAK